MNHTEGPAGVIGADERDVVFVSYARDNGEKIVPLIEALQAAGTRLWMDVEDIRPATEWIHEIEAGITNARAFLALLSPEYLASSACLHELEFARESGKATVSVALGDLEGQEVPSWLGALHWITWNPEDPATGVAAAVTMAVSTDVSWSDLHSRLQARSWAWSRRGRPTSDLLRGAELDEAERELALLRPDGQPFPTPLQREYALAGRAHQRRFARRVISAVSLVAVLSVLLAGVAVWQSVAARQALAKSDFERFRAAASASPDLTRRARLSLAASAAADRAGLTPASSSLPLVEAFQGAGDLPVLQFDIRPENQTYSGDHEGVAVSGDGSTLAYLGLNGVLHVVDLWTLDGRATFTPIGWPEHDLPQIALSFDGSRLLYAAGIADSRGVLREYDISRASPSVEVEEDLQLGDRLAAVSFGPKPKSYTIVQVSGEILIADVASDGPHLTVLGDQVLRTNAGVMLVTFSSDANRVCLTGDAQAFYQLSAPKLISHGSHLTNCVPEPCSANAANHIELDDAGEATCVSPNGETVASIDDCEKCTRHARISGEDGIGYRAVVPGPNGDQIIEYGSGFLRVHRPSDGTLPASGSTMLPGGTTQMWSSNGQDVVVPQPDGEVHIGGDAPLVDSRPDQALVKALWDSPGQMLSTGDVATLPEGRLEVRSGESADPAVLVEGGVKVHAWFGDLVALGRGSRLEVWDVGRRELIDSRDLNSGICAVGWSMGGRRLGAAGCSSGGESFVSAWPFAGGSLADAVVVTAPLPAVDSVSVSNDGAVITVSRTSGETAVWNDGKWIADSRLNAAASETNDYHAGWSVVDESGSWLLVRKNQQGIELWSIRKDGIARASTLLKTDPYEVPVIPRFDDTTLELAWVDTGGGGIGESQVRKWDLSSRKLTEPLCLLASATAVQDDPTGGDASRYDDPCADWTRALPDEPVVAAPTVTKLPTGQDEPHKLRLRNYDTIEFGPNVGLDTIVTDPSSISVLSLIGSHHADVDLDDLSVIRTSKVIDGASFKYAVVDERTRDEIAAVWCGGTYRFSRSGPTTQVKFSNGEQFVACNPIGVAADVLWTISAPGFVGVDAEGNRHEVPLPKFVASGFVRGFINVGPNGLLVLIVPAGGGSPQLVRLDATKESVSVNDAPDLIGPLAAGSDGIVWAATEGGARLLRADGTTEDVTFPDLSRVTSMTVDSFGRLWFAARTTIGLVTADGTVRFKAVAGAQNLSEITFVQMGGYLAVFDDSTNTLIRFSMAEH